MDYLELNELAARYDDDAADCYRYAREAREKRKAASPAAMTGKSGRKSPGTGARRPRS